MNKNVFGQNAKASITGGVDFDKWSPVWGKTVEILTP